MAKLTANCCMMGVSSNVSKGVTYNTAQLFFDDDNTSMPVGIDRENPSLLTELSKMKRVDGVASIVIREFKGNKYLDLVSFVPKGVTQKA